VIDALAWILGRHRWKLAGKVGEPWARADGAQPVLHRLAWHARAIFGQQISALRQRNLAGVGDDGQRLRVMAGWTGRRAPPERCLYSALSSSSEVTLQLSNKKSLDRFTEKEII